VAAWPSMIWVPIASTTWARAASTIDGCTAVWPTKPPESALMMLSVNISKPVFPTVDDSKFVVVCRPQYGWKSSSVRPAIAGAGYLVVRHGHGPATGSTAARPAAGGRAR
jgi:hypothetical protein